MDRREEYTARPENLAEVICAELDYITERREVLDLKPDSVRTQKQELEKTLKAKKRGKEGGQTASSNGLESSARTRPGLKAGLVGLALSGGGIRSATFNLGLLQALAKADILRHVDYLSTVSGGGYIGSCLTSLLHPEPAPWKSRPVLNGVLWQVRGEEMRMVDSTGASEPASETEPRSQEENEVPVVSVSAAQVPFRFENDQKGDERSEVKHLRAHGTYLLPSGRLFSPDFWRMVGMYLTGVVVNNFVPLAVLFVLAYLLNRFKPQLGEFAWSHAYVAAALVFLVAVLIRAFATLLNLSYRTRRIRGRLIGALAALSAGVAAVGGLIQLSTSAEVVLEAVKTFLNGASAATVAGLTAGLVRKGEKLWQIVMDKVFQVARVALVPLMLLQGLIWLSTTDLITMQVGELITLPVDLLEQVPIFLALSLVLVAASLYINPNRTSMHHFYRDRLSEAYLIRSTKGGRVESNEDLDLNDLYPSGGKSGAPYHIINTTLNVPSTSDPELRGRGSDLFIYSGFYCGSEATNYCRTDVYSRIGDTRLATAMAISGAAMSPQRGSSTGPVMSFLFTLLNLRLNRWVPNPRRQFYFKPLSYFKWEFEWRFRLRPWPLYFFKELFSRGTEKDILLNLSDGGHFENLGVYPLLQRRCKYVIVSDAGMDPEFNLADLSNLIRRARVDLGVDIEVDLRGLKRDANKRTPLHHAVGVIKYPGKEGSGLFVFIKTTLKEKEPQDLVDYKRKSPTFPDESTGDQFFREPQFESYRKLGELSGKEVISSAREKLQGGFDGNGRFIEKAPIFFQAVVDRYKEQLPHESKSASSPKK